MSKCEITIIPAVRVSNKIYPHVRTYSNQNGFLVISVEQDTVNKEIGKWEFNAGVLLSFKLPLDDISGHFYIHFYFCDENMDLIEHQLKYYEIVSSDISSSKLLDGCWIDLYHWSEHEGKNFNKALKKLTEEDWKQQIYSMARIGIRGVVIQSLFFTNEYVGENDLTLENYHGKAFYPSDLYPDRFDIKAKDVLPAILEAAQDCNMHVLLGIGLFAWFDFSSISLEWHKRIAKELFDKYGHFDSFYGYYVSEEIQGSLYDEFSHIENERWREVVVFFKEFKEYINEFSPTKPVAFAPNNIRFHEFESEWLEILKNIDILCEIRIYDEVEQIYGYEYTGHLNDPACPHDLGGSPAKELYKEYQKYYDSIISS